MTTIINASLLIALLLTTVIYSNEWDKGPAPEKDKIIRTAVWKYNNYELKTTNAHADETSCVYNAANCALDQVRNRVY